MLPSRDHISGLENVGEDVFRRKGVIKLLLGNKISASDIQTLFKHSCGERCIAASSVGLRVKHLQAVYADIGIQTSSGTASTERNKWKIDVLFGENRHVTVRKISAENEIEPRAVEEIVEFSAKWKIFTRYLPRFLTCKKEVQRRKKHWLESHVF